MTEELVEALRRELDREDEDRAERVQAFRRELEDQADIPESPDWALPQVGRKSFDEIMADPEEADDQAERDADVDQGELLLPYEATRAFSTGDLRELISVLKLDAEQVRRLRTFLSGRC